MDKADPVAIVTGGGTGIGATIAQELARQGVAVARCDPGRHGRSRGPVRDRRCRGGHLGWQAGPRAARSPGNTWHGDGGQVLPGARSKISAD